MFRAFPSSPIDLRVTSLILGFLGGFELRYGRGWDIYTRWIIDPISTVVEPSGEMDYILAGCSMKRVIENVESTLTVPDSTWAVLGHGRCSEDSRKRFRLPYSNVEEYE